jgi:hypothetical protein
MAVVKIERGKMARAKQSAVGNSAQTEVSLFMRTGPFAGKNPVAIANQQQIDGLRPHAEDGLVRQAAQRADRNGYRRHNTVPMNWGVIANASPKTGPRPANAPG